MYVVFNLLTREVFSLNCVSSYNKFRMLIFKIWITKVATVVLTFAQMFSGHSRYVNVRASGRRYGQKIKNSVELDQTQTKLSKLETQTRTIWSPLRQQHYKMIRRN